MKIEIESKENIEKRAAEPFPANTALISVADPDHGFAMLKNKPDYLLQIKFDDVTNEMLQELALYPEDPDMAGEALPVKNLRWMNYDKTKEIPKFIKSILSKAELLICQCDEYGQSCSAGIAAAISQYLYKNDSEILEDDRYHPSELMYRKVLADFNNMNEAQYDAYKRAATIYQTHKPAIDKLAEL